jgi:glycosyltransferase involved in cell wall biosynthesis
VGLRFTSPTSGSPMEIWYSRVELAREVEQIEHRELLVGDFVPGAEDYRPFHDLYRHTAHVPHFQLPEVYRAADVFVLLADGLGLVVLEAMSCGLPVIVTPRGPGGASRRRWLCRPRRRFTAIIEALERLLPTPSCSWGAMRDYRQSAGPGQDTAVMRPIVSCRTRRADLPKHGTDCVVRDGLERYGLAAVARVEFILEQVAERGRHRGVFGWRLRAPLPPSRR